MSETTVNRNLKVFFDEHDDEYLTAPMKTTSPDLTAFMLLDYLVPGQKDMISSAEHDEFYLSVIPEEVNAVATDEELLILIRCGVLYSAEYDSFMMFV